MFRARESMMDMEALVSQICSTGSGELGQLLNFLKQHEDGLRQQAHRLQAALQSIDAARHSLGVLYLMEARWHGASPSVEDGEYMFLAIANFISVCSADQIRMAPEKFISLCRKLKDQALHSARPIRAVLPLQLAIRKLQPSPEHLTPLHSEFFLVCLLSKCYKAAVSVLEDEVVEVDPKRTGITSKDYLLYCYYGGMVLIGLKRFPQAIEFLQHAFTAPAHVLNAVAIEAYKKYVLVCLIQTGQVPGYPKYTPSAVQRSLKTCCLPYVEFQNVCSNRNVTELKQCLNGHHDTFKSDRNLGLAKQVVASLYKRNIQRLTQTYLTLSLQDIAETVQLESAKEAELHVLQMIQDGEIFATINQKDGMVSFQEDPEQYKTKEMSNHLHQEIHKVVRLAKKLTSVDEEVSCDPSFVAKLGKEWPRRFDPDDFEIPAKAFTHF